MANDVINPFQQFRDDGGRVLARGTIEFFENGQEVTQLTIYADSDLTTAQSNPYTLDDYGRVRADVHYQGQATLVISNADGLRIRRLDDVTVTNDGQLENTTVYKDSVAAMVTDEGLAEGQIVRTQSYYAGNNYGGARYQIVSSISETPDDFLIHALNNGLFASLLDRERNNDFLVAGARGDGGSNDTDPMQRVIDQGGDVKVQGGFEFVATNLEISQDVRFIGSGTLAQLSASSGDLFQITSTTVRSVKFRGVQFNGNQIQGNDGNSIVGWVLEDGE